MRKAGRTDILAIDPGTKHLGYAFFVGPELSDFGVKTITQNVPVKEKIESIGTSIEQLAIEKKPTGVVIEMNNFSQITQNLVLSLAIARIKQKIRRKGIPIIEIHPRTVKASICADGNAKKAELARTLVTLYPQLKVLLKSDRNWKVLYHHNAFDAIGCGLAYLRTQSRFINNSNA